MWLLIIGIVSMFVLLGLGFVVVYTCLFIVWLISFFFDRDERKQGAQEMEAHTQQTMQMVNQLKSENQAMSEKINGKKNTSQK
ncbi:hypothetical protein FD688_01460 [Apilactobacillus kunkeei]|uniref:hypothetical protein n=1 Tax=Apilactobacillus kunkeei TaxID=148814 RepID=UPI00110CBF74|nr:hypothetical protein [Apilactobacillus kunkeei]TMT01509.1 hypothetical protein FD688_01460 [Apilactobacillus kunkeei]